MPPIRYPHFKTIPVSLSDKRSLLFSKSVADNTVSQTDRFSCGVERHDLQDEAPTEPPKERIKKKLWDNRNDYLFMLVFLSANIYDAWNCVDLSVKYGGYVIFIYIFMRFSFSLVISYVIVFLTVYSKKSILVFGRMLPVLTGFGYALLFFATMISVSKLRRFTCFSIFIYFSLSQKLTSCEHFPELEKREPTKDWCISIDNSTALFRLIGLNHSCKSVEHTLLIKCSRSKEFILSSATLARLLFFNMRMKYLTLVLAFISYGIILFFIRREQPFFIKVARLAFVSLIAYNLIIIFASYFFPGHEKGFHYMFHFSSKPSSKGLFLAITTALPSVSEMFVCLTATTGRLPLCTVPAIDCTLISVGQVFITVIVSTANLVIIGVMSKAFNLSEAAFAGEFVPYISAPYFLSLLPLSSKTWVVIFFLVHAFYDFIKALLFIEAILVNITWHLGMNKVVFTIIHIIIFFVVLYLFLKPNEADIHGLFLYSVVINLSLLTAFCFGLTIYGVKRLEEDITFMTSSPPSELVTRTIKILPLVCIGLLIWGRLYVVDVFHIILHYGIIISVVGELIFRLLFFHQHSEPPLQPSLRYGPPNLQLRSERKAFSFETRRLMDSNSSRTIYNQNKREIGQENV